MRLLMKDPYESKYILGSVMLGEDVPFLEACLADNDIILQLGRVWISTSIWSLNFSHNFIILITAYLLLCQTAHSPVFILSQFPPCVKNARSVRMEGLFMETSVLCSWCVNNILPVLDSSRRSWQWLFLLVVGLSVSFLGTCTPFVLGICHRCSGFSHFFSIAASVGTSFSVPIFFRDPSVFPSVSCSHRGCHSCLSTATASCSNQLGPRESENWDSFTFPSHRELCVMNNGFPLYFLLQKTCFTLLIKIRLFGETFTGRWGHFLFSS